MLAAPGVDCEDMDMWLTAEERSRPWADLCPCAQPLQAAECRVRLRGLLRPLLQALRRRRAAWLVRAQARGDRPGMWRRRWAGLEVVLTAWSLSDPEMTWTDEEKKSSSAFVATAPAAPAAALRPLLPGPRAGGSARRLLHVRAAGMAPASLGVWTARRCCCCASILVENWAACARSEPILSTFST